MSARTDDQPTRILLIEDDPAVAASLRSGLERERYAVERGARFVLRRPLYYNEAS